MLDYDEMTQLVLKMRDEAIEKDRRRKMLLKRSAAAALSACAAGAVIVISHNIKKPLDPHNGSSVVIPDSTSAQETPMEETEAATAPSTRDTAETAAVSQPSENNTRTTAAGMTSGSLTETVTAAAPGRKGTETAPPVNGTVSGSIISRTEAAATSVAMPAETAAPVTTTIVYDTERSIDMKKLVSLAASLSILSSVSGFPSTAVAEAAQRNDVTAEDLTIFAELDSGRLNADVNLDGTFDIRDPFELLAYDYGKITDQSKAERLSATGDLDHDGTTGSNDARVLIKYYIEKGMFTKEQLLPSYYEDLDIKIYRMGDPIYGCIHPEVEELFASEDFDKCAYTPEELEELYALENETGIIGYEKIEEDFSGIFISRLKSYLTEADSYTLFKSGVKTGMIDLDIDSDGTAAYEDVNTYWLFMKQRPVKESIERNNAWVYSGLDTDLDPEGRLALLSDEFVTSIPDDQWAKCEAIYSYCVEGLEMTDSEICAMKFIYERDGIPDGKYIDNSYYESILEGSGSAAFGYALRYHDEASRPVVREMPYDPVEYSRLLNEYCNSVAAGELTPPDANGDGVLSYKDVVISVLYEDDYRYGVTREDSVIPASAWDFFESQLDLNDNGICGEYCDIHLYEMMVSVYVDEISETESIPDLDANGFTAYRDEYVRELRAAKGNADPQAAPLMSGGDSDVFVGSAGTDIRGDANLDGKLDVADSVAVLQYISNSAKYPLSDQGKKNADIDGAEGLTGGDAIAIQRLDAGIE